MRYADWFDRNRKQARALARHFDICTPAVYQWAQNGVPIERMAGVQEFTANKVKVADMVAEAAERRIASKAPPVVVPERRRADRRAA